MSEDNLVQLPHRGVFGRHVTFVRRDASERESVHGLDVRPYVHEALQWRRASADADHLDAAFAVACRVEALGGARWPRFVDAVRAAVEAEAER